MINNQTKILKLTSVHQNYHFVIDKSSNSPENLKSDIKIAKSTNIYLIINAVNVDLNMNISFVHSGLFVNVYLLCYGNKTKQNIKVNIEHNKNNCSSKYNSLLLANDSTISNKCNSYIPQGTVGNKTIQKIRGIFLTKKSVIKGEPNLEILSLDSESKHGVNIGYISPESIDYLKLFGLEEAVAEKMMIQGSIGYLFQTSKLRTFKYYYEGVL